MSSLKRKQGPKPGKVIRISEQAWKFLNEKTPPDLSTREAVDHLIHSLIDLSTYVEATNRAKSFFILPESRVVCSSVEEARGEAIMRAVKRGKKQPLEEPLEVREVL